MKTRSGMFAYIIGGLAGIAVVVAVNSREKYPWPEVGQCFERYIVENQLDTMEIVKVIKVDRSSRFDAITYVYNFPHSENFKKGQWYTLPPLTSEGKDWFMGDSTQIVKKIECPW